jgi:acyl-coenzyme A thioesterase PaaI-like protein
VTALVTAATVSGFVPPPATATDDVSFRYQQQSHFRTGIASVFKPRQTCCLQHQMQVDDSYYYERMNHPARTLSENHVIFGHLLQPNLLERYHVYKRINKDNTPSQEIVLADIKLGERLNGHEGVVHGGVLALLLDDTMGYSFEALGVKHAVTANLHIDYRLPVPAGTLIVIKVYLKERVGRKLYFESQVTCPKDGNKVYAEATSLFIIPREFYQEDAEQEVVA